MYFYWEDIKNCLINNSSLTLKGEKSEITFSKIIINWEFCQPNDYYEKLILNTELNENCVENVWELYLIEKCFTLLFKVNV